MVNSNVGPEAGAEGMATSHRIHGCEQTSGQRSDADWRGVDWSGMVTTQALAH